MELIVKHFSELSTKELWELYKLRVSVFVVEQKCPYQEVDDSHPDCCRRRNTRGRSANPDEPAFR